MIFSKKKKKKKKEDEGCRGVSIVAQQVKDQHSLYEDAGSISGLAQWIKDLVLPQAVA